VKAFLSWLEEEKQLLKEQLHKQYSNELNISKKIFFIRGQL